MVIETYLPADIFQMQLDTCQKFGVEPLAVYPLEKVGIARNVKTGLMPLNGERHAPFVDPDDPNNRTSGWYFWAGTEIGRESDFFAPIHAIHVGEWCINLLPFMLLPPGWRFLIDPTRRYMDVWHDPSLLSS